MKPSVYIETTIPSLLTAWPNRDVQVAAQQVNNAIIQQRLRGVCHAAGFELPVICTPNGLLGTSPKP